MICCIVAMQFVYIVFKMMLLTGDVPYVMLVDIECHIEMISSYSIDIDWSQADKVRWIYFPCHYVFCFKSTDGFCN